MFIYQHRRLDTNEIFYIGIGKTKQRAYNKYHRSELWKRVTNKVGYNVEIIAEADTLEEACQIEQYLIKYYGRRDLGLGNLINMTDGGEGFFNGTHSIKSKLKMSLSKKGKTSPNKGKKMSEEQKIKISKTNKGRKPSIVSLILDTQTGVFYNSITEASIYYDIKRTTLNAMLSGQNKNKTNLIII